MTHQNWTCPKCGHRAFDVGEMRASGGALASVFDVENKRFTSVTCARCAYTEFYRTSAKGIDNVFDLFVT